MKRLATGLALLALVVPMNEYEASRIDKEVESADAAFSRLLQNLASESVVVRIGAIGQVARQMRRKVPVQHRLWPWEGGAYLFGLTAPEAGRPYHDDLQAMIRALIGSPKSDHTAEMESEAIIGLLCDLGPEGWYEGSEREPVATRTGALSWIWQNAPTKRLSDSPSYTLFRGCQLSHASFARFEMRRAEFTAARLSSVSFADCRLDNSTFTGATLQDILFENASLQAADFTGATLRGVRFAGADLKGADFRTAIFDDVDLRGAREADKALGLDSCIPKIRCQR